MAIQLKPKGGSESGEMRCAATKEDVDEIKVEKKSRGSKRNCGHVCGYSRIIQMKQFILYRIPIN